MIIENKINDIIDYKITISSGGVLTHRGGFGTFGWKGTGRWTDSEAGKTYLSAAAKSLAPGAPLTGPGRWR